jgi:hypothetical protein
MGEPETIRGTIDELARQEIEIRNVADQPDYVFYAKTPYGEIVYGHPPMWGRYVLMPPWQLYDDESELSVGEEKARVPIFELSFGYGW